MKNLIIAASAALALLGAVPQGRADDSVVVSLIKELEAVKIDKKHGYVPETTAPIVSVIVIALISSDHPEDIKRELLTGFTKKKYMALADASFFQDKQVLQLLYMSKLVLPGNLTDKQLRSAVGGRAIIKLQKKALAPWVSKGKEGTEDLLDAVVAQYPPEDAVGLVRAVTRPYFAQSKKATGAVTTASASLANVYEQWGKFDMCNNSVGVKLLWQMGYLYIQPDDVDMEVDFTTSNMPPIMVQFPRTQWYGDAPPILVGFLPNAYYGETAAEVLLTTFPDYVGN